MSAVENLEKTSAMPGEQEQAELIHTGMREAMGTLALIAGCAIDRMAASARDLRVCPTTSFLRRTNAYRALDNRRHQELGRRL